MRSKLILLLVIGFLFFASTGSVWAGACTPAAGSPGPGYFQNPLTICSIESFLGSVLARLNAVIALIAVLFIVIGGLMYIFAAGDDKKITSAKNIIKSAIIGFVIAIAAGTFLKEIAEILGYNTATNPLPPEVTGARTIKQIVEKTLTTLLSIVGIIAIIGIVVGGFFYLTAYGNDDQVKKGKSIIKSSIIGITIALAALVIVRLVAGLIQ